jgi:hypothetical protein
MKRDGARKEVISMATLTKESLVTALLDDKPAPDGGNGKAAATKAPPEPTEVYDSPEHVILPEGE